MSLVTPIAWFHKRCAVIVCLAVALGVLPPDAAAAEASTVFDVSYPKQRLPAPGFQLPDLAAVDVSLEHYRTRVVLVHFWATFCAPCVKEMPDLEALWQRYREQDLVVLAIAADRGSGGAVHAFVDQTGVTFPVLLDPDGVVRNTYEVVALPTSYLIGRDGKISARAIGTRVWNGTEGRKVIEAQLAAGRSR
mgnify:CR=1 FL=1